MVSVVTGSGLGLFNTRTSAATPGLGQKGEQIFVNATNGNLVVQDFDESINVTGVDLNMVRTYNSQGLVDGDNNDNWKIGVYRQVTGLTGTVNTVGSKITKVFGDAAEVIYTYAAANGPIPAGYYSSNGDGARDSLTFSGSQWTWTDGSSRNTETYDSNGKLLNMKDADGNTITYGYTGSLLTSVTSVAPSGLDGDGSTQTVQLNYVGNNLQNIQVSRNGVVQTLTSYTYDASNRLSTVKVDLTPADTTDSKVYLTTYTYDSTSKRIASITQSDGTTIGFTYYTSGTNVGKLNTYTDGAGKVTTLTYTPTNATLPATATVTNTGLLTAATTWGDAGVREKLPAAATGAQMLFDKNGNGAAIWTQGATLMAISYDKNSRNWGTAASIVGTLTGNVSSAQLSMNANGVALVTWVQNSNVYARRLINGVMETSPPTLLKTGTAAGANPVGTINDNGRAAVAFVQGGNLMVSRFDGTAWSGAIALDDQGAANANAVNATVPPSITIDPSGDIGVLWLQKLNSADAGESLYFSRYDALANAWSNPNSTLLENTSTAVTAAQIEFDNSGNGIAAFLQGGTLNARSFTLATGSWSANGFPSNITGASAPSLSVSANGTALLSWAQTAGSINNIVASVYSGGTWSAAQTIESLTGAASVPVSAINDAGQGVVSFVQNDGTANRLYATRYINGAWETNPTSGAITATRIDSPNTIAIAAGMTPSVTIDRLGDIDVLWGQKAAAADAGDSVFSARLVTDLTPYYQVTVTATTTWQTIANDVYGDSSAAGALQAWLGNIPIASVGDTMKITVPPRLDYVKSIAVNQVDIKDPLNQITSYFVDSATGLLRQVQSPPPVTNAARPATSYLYDANGNVVEVIDGNGNVNTSSYDANDNLLSVRDALGNTTTYTYNTANQLTTETHYLVPDPDASSFAPPAQPLVTRYVYDGENHLRFLISADGRVTEYRYDRAGNAVATAAGPGRLTTQLQYLTLYTAAALPSEADMVSWAGPQALKAERTDYAYDFRGNTTSVTAWAVLDPLTGNGANDGNQSVTQFVYDQRGNLLQTLDPRGSGAPNPANAALGYATTYLYDGLGRVLSATQWLSLDAITNVNKTVTTLTNYDDANHRIVATLSNGLATTTTYDARGLVVSIAQANGASALGSSTFQYDAEGKLRVTIDPMGHKSYRVYDADDRLVAQIDATGAMTENTYDNAGNIVKITGYATLVTSANLTLLGDASNTAVTVDSIRPAADAANDRVTRTIYDAANRAVMTILSTDGSSTSGYVTQNFYDGAGRLTDIVGYATAIAVPAVLTAANVTSIIKISSDDRHVRKFYDKDGDLTGELDGEGALCEYRYDGAAQMTDSVCYATTAPAAMRANGTLAALINAVNPNPATPNPDDQHSYVFYDTKGQVIASLDAAGYLTEYQYDKAGNETQAKRWGTPARAFTGTPVLANLRPRPQDITDINDAVTVTTYDGFNRVTLQTDTTSGTRTQYIYDDAGNLTETDRAWVSSDQRSTRTRYDSQGRVLQELTPNGSVILVGLGSGATQAQIDRVWSQYSTTYTYDLDGNRLSATDPDGNRTLYYYDADDRLRYSIDALGEVTETRYNAFSEVSETFHYTGRIASTGAWSPVNLLEATASNVQVGIVGLQTVFDKNGNGIAVYLRAGGAVEMREYDAVSASWGDAVAVSDGNSVKDSPSLAMSDNGNVIIVWTEVGNVSVARRVGGVWSGVGGDVVLGTGGGITGGLNATAAINDSGDAAVVFLQSDGVRNNLVGARLHNGVWSGVENLDDHNASNNNSIASTVKPVVTVSPTGNVAVLWMQKIGVDAIDSLCFSRYNSVLGTWTGLTVIVARNTAVTGLQIATGGDGNTLAAWSQGGILVTASFNLENSTFTIGTQFGAVAGSASLAMNQSGAAILAFSQSNNILAAMYTNGAWGAAQIVETLSGNAFNPAASINDNGQAAVAFVQNSGAVNAPNHVFANRYVNGAWQTVTQLENSTPAVAAGTTPRVAISYTGDITAIWQQAAAGQTLDSAYFARFVTTGGPVTAALTAAVAAIATPATDAHTRVNYTLRGAVKDAIKARDGNASNDLKTTYTYNAFGDLTTELDPVINVAGASNTATSTLSRFSYDHRGLVVKTIDDDDNGSVVGIKRTNSAVYDAFGRVIQNVDGNGNLHSAKYDRLGRVVTVTDPSGSTKSTYDAFDRVLTRTDALGNQATYGYVDATRSSILSSAAGFQVITTLTRLGQTSTVRDGNLNTTGRSYDSDGNLTNESTSSADFSTLITGQQSYDGAGNLISTTDGNGIVTKYTYDAANRLLTTNVDPLSGSNPAGLNLVTRYTYDGQGRTLTVTDPKGVVTQMTYDARGQVTQTVVDPTGLNLRTSYTYDASGQTLTVVSGVGSAIPVTTQYVYDDLGRRIETHVDPAGLNLTTRYAYDKDDNVTLVTDPNGAVSRFYYDGSDQQIYALDPLNELTQSVYDADGQVIKQVSYATPLTGGGFPAAPSKADIDARIAAIADATRDDANYFVYDKDGQQVYSINALGEISRNFYDGDGNVVRTTRYGFRVRLSDLPTPITQASVDLMITSVKFQGLPASPDVDMYFFYDGADRQIYSVDSLGEVTQTVYDNNSNVIAKTRYGVRVDMASLFAPAGGTTVEAALAQAFLQAGTGALPNEGTQNVYDSANRLVYSFDALGELSRFFYDGDGNVIQTVRYANRVDVGAHKGALDVASVTKALFDAGGPDQLHDIVANTVYDAAGRVIETSDALGDVTRMFYDANGNCVKTVEYTNARNPSGVVPTNAASDVVTYAVYNAANRLIYSFNSLGELTQNFYDANGNVTKTIEYANRIASSYYQLPATATTWRIVAATLYGVDSDAAGLALRTALNGAATPPLSGKLTFNALPPVLTVGAAIYNLRVDQLTENNTAALVSAQVTTNALADLVEYKVYDAVGRAIYAFNAQGEVTQYSYDALGDVTKVIEYANRISPSYYQLPASTTWRIVANTLYGVDSDAAGTALRTAVGGAATPAANGKLNLTALPPVLTVGTSTFNLNTAVLTDNNTVALVSPMISLNTGADLISYSVYDAAQRQVYDINALGEVTQNVYDTSGNVIKSTHYANRIAIPQAISAASIATAITQAAVSLVGDMVSYSIYDAAERLIYSFNSLGELTQNIYDTNGQLVNRIDYATRISPAYYQVPASSTTWRAVALGLYGVDSDAAGLALRTALGAGATPPTGGKIQMSALPAVLTVGTSTFNLNPAVLTDNNLAALVSSQVQPSDPGAEVSRYVYDAAGRVVFTVDGIVNSTEGATVVEYTYDAAGHVTRTKGYSLPIAQTWANDSPLTQANLRGGSVLRTNSDTDRVQYRVYDAAGRMTASVTVGASDDNSNQFGEVVSFGYDARGNEISRKTYAKRIALNTWVVGSDPTPAVDTAHDRRVRTMFDAAGRVSYVLTDATDISTLFTNKEGVTRFAYDAHGNLIDSIAYANLIENSTALNKAALDAAQSLTTADQHERFVYDNANRLVYGVDGVGAVTQTVYDAHGNATKIIAYATAISATAAPGSVVSSVGNDRITVMTYDAANRQVYLLDALGGLSQNAYDSRGNVVQFVAFAPTLAPPTLAGVYTTASIASAVSSAMLADPGNRISYSTFDAANRKILDVDALGDVIRNQYDAFGNVVQITAYALPISLFGITAANAAALLPGQILANATNDRVTRFQFDAFNRHIATMDALGNVTRTTYDAFDQVVATDDYVVKVATSTAPQNILSTLSSQPNFVAGDRHTAFFYDQAGRLVFTIDALGFNESQTYDGAGNKLAFINKNGAVWTYDYDAVGNVIKELTPQVALTALTQTGALGSLRVDATNTLTAAVETRFGYDALGNLVVRSEAIGRPEARSTFYTYDALGRQIKTMYSAVGVYDYANDSVTTNGATPWASNTSANGIAVRVEQSKPLTTETTYDALGNAISNLDVAGNRSYKTYDLLGKVAYEIDAMGGVTGYARNAFGEVTALTRYAVPKPTMLTGTGQTSLTAAQKLTLASAGDRTITTVYDALGRAVLVTEPAVLNYDPDLASSAQYFTAGKTTRNSYDAFGDIVQVSQLKHPDQSVPVRHALDIWNYVLTNYYDLDGRNVAQVDALGNLTTMRYDAFGNLTRRTEFATPIPNYDGAHPPLLEDLDAGVNEEPDKDRRTEYIYDALNRLTTKTEISVPIVGTDEFGDLELDPSVEFQSVVTTFGYDAVGNQVRMTDALGGNTFTYYDALGRVTAVISPARIVAQSTDALLQNAHSPDEATFWATPLTEYKLDALGNVLIKYEYTFGAGSESGEQDYGLPFDQTRRTTFSKYDSGGHVTQITDAGGINHYNSYNELGELAKTWQQQTDVDTTARTSFQVYRYDKLGRLTDTLDPASIYFLQTATRPAANFTQAVTNSAIGSSTSHTLRLTWTSASLVDTRNGAGNVRVSFTAGGITHTQDFPASGLNTGTSVTWIDTGNGAVTNLIVSQQITDASGTNSWVSLWPTNNSPLGFVVATQTQAQAGLTDNALTYNTFGEITAKGQRPWLSTQALQETFEYDNAGRLWRTNSGDGALKVTLYDLQGRATANITSNSDGDTTWTTSTVDQIATSASISRSRTDLYYDAMGHLIKTVLPMQLVDGGSVSVSQDQVSMSGTPLSAKPSLDANLQLVWTGSNEVDVATTGLALTTMGSGDIKVEVHYASAAYSLTANDADGNLQTVSGTAQNGVFTQVFAANAPLHVIWKNPNGSKTGGVSSVSSISIYKRDLSGNWVLLNTVLPNSVVVPPKNVIWLSRPVDPNSTVSLILTQNGVNTDVSSQMANFGDLMRFDASNLLGSYTYTASMTLSNGTTVVTSTGTFTPPPLQSIAGNITMSGATASFTSPATDIATFSYRLAGTNGLWIGATAVGGTPVGTNKTWTVSLSALPAGSYEFEVLFLHGLPSAPYTHATGTLTVNGTTTKTFALAKAATPPAGAVSVRWGTYAGAAGMTSTLNNVGAQIRPEIDMTVDRYGDVLTQTDPRSANFKTTFTYTKDGQVSSQSTGLNWLNYTFDALGRRIGTIDASGTNYQLFDEGNNLANEVHADGGLVRYFYDIFGDRVGTLDAMGNMSGATYDDLGRLTATKLMDKNGLQLVNVYGYDEKGNRNLQINYDGVFDYVTGAMAAETQEGNIKYRYDLMGNLQQITKAGGGVTSAVYDGRGNKIYEIDPDRNLTSSVYDYFGKLHTQVDIGGATTTYVYFDNSGLLEHQSSTRGQNINYGYDFSGRLVSETNGIIPGSSPTMSIAYDLAGNRVREKTTAIDGTVLQDNHITYDAAGRMTETTDGRTFMHIDYDSANNRTHIETRAYGLIPDLQDGSAVALYGVNYFAYDSMNRQIVVDAPQAVDPNVLWGSEAQLGRTGHAIKYDLDGNRIQDISWRDYGVITHEGTIVAFNLSGVHTPVLDPLGNVLHTDTTYEFVGGFMSTENYVYDQRNNLKGVIRDGSLIDYRLYDLQGRALTTGGGMYHLQDLGTFTYSTAAGYGAKVTAAGHDALTTGLETRWNTYDADGNLTVQDIYNYDSKHTFRIDYTGGYDQAGNLRHYQMKSINDPNAWNTNNPDGESTVYTNTYDYTLARFSGYQVKQISGTSTQFDPGTTINTYDVGGNLIKTEDTTQPASTRTFLNDVGGRTLLATQNGNVQRQLIVNGEVLGRYGTVIDESKPRDSNGNPVFLTNPIADFNFNYLPVTPAYPTPTPGGYRVRGGDTLRGIAQAAYGDASLWYVIADANGLTGSETLTAGQLLSIPNHVETVHNNSSTYNPYNPVHILGDQTPFLPKGDSGCGGWGKFLAITLAVAVAVAVSVVTYGAAAPALAGVFGSVLGGVLAGAAAGAAASIASQTVLVTTGVQKDFSGTEILEGALFGAIGGGLQSAMSGVTQGLQQAALNAGTTGAKVSQAISLAVEEASIAGAASITGQEIEKGVGFLAHKQVDFSWSKVALAATSGGVNGLVQAGMGNLLHDMGDGFTKQLLTQTASSLIATPAAALARGGRIDYTVLAADAFGTALGAGLTEGAIASIESSRLEDAQNWRKAALARMQGQAAGLAADASSEATSDAVSAAASKRLNQAFGKAAQESSDRTTYMENNPPDGKIPELYPRQLIKDNIMNSAQNGDGGHWDYPEASVDISGLQQSIDQQRGGREEIEFEEDPITGEVRPTGAIYDMPPSGNIGPEGDHRSAHVPKKETAPDQRAPTEPPPFVPPDPAATAGALQTVFNAVKGFVAEEGEVFANAGKAVWHQMHQPGAIMQDVVSEAQVLWNVSNGNYDVEMPEVQSDLIARVNAGSNPVTEVVSAGVGTALLAVPPGAQVLMAGYGLVDGVINNKPEQVLLSGVGLLGARSAVNEFRAANAPSALEKSMAQGERAQAAASGGGAPAPISSAAESAGKSTGRGAPPALGGGGGRSSGVPPEYRGGGSGRGGSRGPTGGGGRTYTPASERIPPGQGGGASPRFLKLPNGEKVPIQIGELRSDPEMLDRIGKKLFGDDFSSDLGDLPDHGLSDQEIDDLVHESRDDAPFVPKPGSELAKLLAGEHPDWQPRGRSLKSVPDNEPAQLRSAGTSKFEKPPRPLKMDITNALKFTPDEINGGYTFSHIVAKDADGGMIHGISGGINRNGELHFQIKAVDEFADIGGTGTDQFVSTMNRLQKDGVHVEKIEGIWSNSKDLGDNWDMYQKGIARRMAAGADELTAAHEAALLDTFTGPLAAAYGFTKVVGLHGLKGSQQVYLWFVRP